jgi:hypothetical protein
VLRIQTLARHWWTLERFGLSPGKLVQRARNRTQSRVFCVTIPKAGTHLLERALCLHPALYRVLLPTVRRRNMDRWQSVERILDRLKPGQVVMAHLPFEPRYLEGLEARQIPYVFMIRDPRDILMAHVFNIARSKRNPFHETLTSQPELRVRIKLVIEGDASLYLPSMDQRLGRFAGWLEGGGLVVRFEDLIGLGGGGTEERQARALSALYAHLGLDADDRLVTSIGGRLFSSTSPTFRKGAIGEWKRYLDEEMRALFLAKAGHHLKRYGYAEDA